MLAQAIVLPFRRRTDRGPVWPHRPVARASGLSRRLPLRVHGHLMLAVGTCPDDVILDLIHLAGGRGARAVVVPAAAYASAPAGERYRRYLQRFGMQRTETVDISSRERAQDPQMAALLAGSDLLVVGGGSPDLLLGVLGGTAAAAGLQAALVRGAALVLFGPTAEAAGEWYLPAGGGSAAAAASSPPTAYGAPWTAHAALPVRQPEAVPPALLRPGLGLLPGTLVAAAPIVDGRVALVFAAALTSGVQALLLDERSALLVRPGWRAEVRAGTVLAVGGANPGRRTEPRARAVEGGSPLGGVYTRVAPTGWQLDLAAHLVLPPGGGAVVRAGSPLEPGL